MCHFDNHELLAQEDFYNNQNKLEQKKERVPLNTLLVFIDEVAE